MHVALLLFIVFLVIFFLWLIGVIVVNDLSIPSKKIKKFKNVLFIYPHADDEVLNSGGLIRALSRQGSAVTLVILTKGEKGKPDGKYDGTLKDIRVHEAKKASDLLGVTTLIQEDFGDGDLMNKKPFLRKYVQDIVEKTNPDLVITYDLAGLYGHPDHVVVSEIVTELIHNSFKESILWYVSFPKRVLSMIRLPEYMAKDPSFINKRVFPSHKISVIREIVSKIRAVYSYKSQYQSFREGLPVKFVPLWFFYSMQLFEYYYEVS